MDGEDDSEKSALLQRSSCENRLFPDYASINPCEVSADSSGAVVELRTRTIYSRRWWIIFVFCLCNATQNIIWNSFSPLTYAMKVAYDWDNEFVAIILGMSSLGFIITAFPFMYLVERRGLRLAMILCCSLMVISLSFWLIGMPFSFNWMIHLGSLLNGMASAIFMAAPPLLSVLWFPITERTTATALSSSAGSVGAGVAFIAGPLLSGANITATDMTKIFSLEYTTSLRSRLLRTLYFDVALAVACLLGVFFYFPAKPPSPPSHSANVERQSFKAGFKSLLKNGSFWLLNIAYNLPNATFGAWVPLISISFENLGVTQNTAGWLGFASMISGVVASVTVSIFADHFKRHTKLFLVAMTLGQMSCFALLVCIQQGYLHVPPAYLQTVLYVICSLSGAFFNGVTPLYYELACECAYPVHEGLSNEFICLLNNLGAVIFYFLFLLPALAKRTLWMAWLCLACSVLSLPLLLKLKVHYKRLALDSSEELRRPQDSSG